MNSKIYEKEILYPTALKMPDGTQENITPAKLDDIIKNYNKMTDRGMKIPLQSEHRIDPEYKRGEVLGLRRNGDHLKAIVKFDDWIDDDTLKALTNCDVSVTLGNDLKDIRGNTYNTALKYLAITSSPQLTGLQPFVSLSTEEFNNMNEDNMYTDNSVPQDAPNTGVEQNTQEEATPDNTPATVDQVTNENLSIGGVLTAVIRVLGIDPNDYANEQDFIEALSLRLSTLVTLSQQLQEQGADMDQLDMTMNQEAQANNEAEGGEDYRPEDAMAEGEEDASQMDVPTNDEEVNMSSSKYNLETYDHALNRLDKEASELRMSVNYFIRKDRKNTINNLIRKGVLTPAAAKTVENKYITKFRGVTDTDGFKDFVEIVLSSQGYNKPGKPLQKPQVKRPMGLTESIISKYN